MTALRVTVGTTAVLLVDATQSETVAWVRNVEAGEIYLGGAGVTAATGFELTGNSQIGVLVRQGRQLWAIRASGSNIVHILRS